MNTLKSNKLWIKFSFKTLTINIYCHYTIYTMRFAYVDKQVNNWLYLFIGIKWGKYKSKHHRLYVCSNDSTQHVQVDGVESSTARAQLGQSSARLRNTAAEQAARAQHAATHRWAKTRFLHTIGFSTTSCCWRQSRPRNM